MLGLPGLTLVACLDQPPQRIAALESAGARVRVSAESAGRVDLESLLRYLAREEINEVLIEAGPTLAGAAIQAGLVDELILYLAPHLMGDGGRGLVPPPWPRSHGRAHPADHHGPEGCGGGLAGHREDRVRSSLPVARTGNMRRAQVAAHG